MAGRVVHRGGVGAAVAGTATAVAVDRRVEADVEPVARIARLELDAHQHRVPVRVGDVPGLDPVAPALRRRRDLADHASGVVNRPHGVGHVARLQVGEGRSVGDDVLERLEVRVVDGRVVDVAQDAVRDRVPDLRARVPRGAEAVLAREVEVRERAGAAGRAGDGGGDGQDVRRSVVGESHLRARDRNVEHDVRPVRDPALAVVLVPALVDRDLPLVRALRQRRRLERVDPVAVGVLQPGAEAARIPVGRTAELGLKASRGDGDDRAPVVRAPVALVVVVELDTRRRGEVERDVRAVCLRVSAVVLVPRVVEGGLVLEAARRK